jgi:hypothetical protein
VAPGGRERAGANPVTMRFAALALAGLTVAVLSAGAGVAADRQSQIQAAYDHECKSAIAKDGSGFASALSPGFIAVDLDRNQEKASDVVAAVVTPPQSTIVQTCRYVIRGFQIDGAIATVLETQTSTGTLLNDAVMKPFVRVQDSTDVWKFSARPLEIASQWTGVRLTVDGDVVQDRGILASPEP